MKIKKPAKYVNKIEGIAERRLEMPEQCGELTRRNGAVRPKANENNGAQRSGARKYKSIFVNVNAEAW